MSPTSYHRIYCSKMSEILEKKIEEEKNYMDKIIKYRSELNDEISDIEVTLYIYYHRLFE